ncbi:Neelaredoxin [candidate division WOR-3 bacterium]|uniref:Neelaredoxin n=1 Tax=candidate division WOR-3 bacterium TaxID=2052148 RepID=A0A9D5QCD1_UNCW3|nr:Neelaredoxin [candidate division WOR-3 bacterium]MBD3364424.1 Neelaredoxin [candidate division WOR-3 bacterium]
MAEHIADKIQTADWKSEKHVPVIDCPDSADAGEWVKVTLTLGKEVAHPNTTEHHIRWIKAYFVPDDGKFAVDLGTFTFNAHGESAEGPNEGPVYTHHEASFSFKTAKSGSINAVSYCNIHGLWENSKKLEVK